LLSSEHPGGRSRDRSTFSESFSLKLGTMQEVSIFESGFAESSARWPVEMPGFEVERDHPRRR
jgi:hypothetical protein